MKRLTRFSLRTLLIVVTVFALVPAYGIQLTRTCLGPVIPRHVSRQLRVGMSRGEVRALLGEPTYENDDWLYERPFNPGWFGVHFDEDGRLHHIDDEHAVR